ncbi:hypothetical protein LCGC14_0737690 [marine sediment metagenome]|uniref:DOD-type homing endonuclease domain-containing protein n=1 Tax=marine sediment metagenome TaxID=412755 RepID=A0A0F9TEU4_9ZZZZ
MNWSYIAGFFDGEGNFHIGRIKMNSGKIAHYLQIRFYNSNKELLERIKKFLGYGWIFTRTREKEGWSDIVVLPLRDFERRCEKG